MVNQSLIITFKIWLCDTLKRTFLFLFPVRAKSYVISTIQIRISVTNLPLSASEKDIWAMFGPFGAVTYVSIVPDITDPASKGTATATVSMPIYDEAIFAIRTLNQNGAKVLYLEIFKTISLFSPIFIYFFSLKITNSVSRSKFLHQPSPTR